MLVALILRGFMSYILNACDTRKNILQVYTFLGRKCLNMASKIAFTMYALGYIFKYMFYGFEYRDYLFY